MKPENKAQCHRMIREAVMTPAYQRWEGEAEEKVLELKRIASEELKIDRADTEEVIRQANRDYAATHSEATFAAQSL